MTPDEVTGLVQDAMFSRSPKTAVRTGMFIGGKNAVLALDMLAAAKKAQFPPFEMSVVRRSGRLVHHGGRDGRLRRDDAEEKEE